MNQAVNSPVDETMEERQRSESEEDLEEGLFQAQSNSNVFGLVEEKKSIVDKVREKTMGQNVVENRNVFQEIRQQTANLLEMEPCDNKEPLTEISLKINP